MRLQEKKWKFVVVCEKLLTFACKEYCLSITNETNRYYIMSVGSCLRRLWTGTDCEADGGSTDGPVGKYSSEE